MEDQLKTYYVTFGMGTFMRGRFQAIRAYSREVVAAYMNKHYPKLWAAISEEYPQSGERLTPTDELYYRRAEDV